MVQAFPDAYGWGAEAIGGRGGKIVEVTTLATAGPGSLETALRLTPEPRIVVFKVAGDIFINKRIRMDAAHSFCYVAGQTAPGDGITIRPLDESVAPLIQFDNGVTDLILRYIKGRPGKAGSRERDAITFRQGKRIMLDHLSLQWATDEIVGFNPDPGTQVSDITIQNSIIGACLRPHSTGLSLSSDNGVDDLRRISLHNNLFVHNAHRNPISGQVPQLEVINNVMYNWKSRIGDYTKRIELDLIGNYAVPGPWRSGTANFRWDSRTYTGPPVIYARGNRAFPTFITDSEADQRGMWLEKTASGDIAMDPSYFTDVRQADGALYPIPIVTAEEALARVLADVGASRRLNADGSWAFNRDSIDAQMVLDVMEGTGPATDAENDNETDYGGYPAINPGTAYKDTDQDGMPNLWEVARSFDPTGPSDGPLIGPDGYSNVETFLNSFVEEEMSVITDLQAIEASLRQHALDLTTEADAVAQVIVDLQALDDTLDAAADVIEPD